MMQSILARQRRAAKFFAAAAFALGAIAGPAAWARDSTTAEVSIAELPAEARDVLAGIRAGAPHRYERDGVVFGNREHQLPAQKRGYYHEYTVPTPGVKTRGARRIVCGGAKTTPDACWYTGDHYQTFARIRE